MGGSWLRRSGGSDHAPLPHPPGSRPDPKGPNHRDPEPPEAVPLRRALLPLPVNGYLLEVRDPTQLRVRILLPLRASPPPEVHHEVAAQRPPHRLRPHFLLASLLCYCSRCQDRPIEQADREAEGPGLNWINPFCRWYNFTSLCFGMFNDELRFMIS